MNGERDPARWQTRWAERENERRRRAYAEALARWRADEAELRTMLSNAHSPRTIPHERVIALVPLRRDEVVLWQAARIGLIEAPEGTPVHDSGYAAFSLRTVRPGEGPPPQVRDHGAALVTSRRVVFRGERVNREWDLRKLTRFAHDPAGRATLIHVSNRKRTSGLVPPASDVPGFRFAFTLATSMSIGRREGFAAHLESLLAELRARFPVPEPPVRAEEAPYGFWRSVYLGRPSMPGWFRVTQGLVAGAVTLFVALAAIGMFLPGETPTPVAQASPTLPGAPSETVSSSPAARRTVARTPTPTPAPTPTPTLSRTPKPTPKPTPRKPRRPSPKPADLCGAPKNPYGYDFCGGSRVYDPKPGTCLYFDCIDYFDEGEGYMVQCRDGTYSLSGGRRGACSHHDGVRRPVHR